MIINRNSIFTVCKEGQHTILIKSISDQIERVRFKTEDSRNKAYDIFSKRMISHSIEMPNKENR
jgi:hypothetical protein